MDPRWLEGRGWSLLWEYRVFVLSWDGDLSRERLWLSLFCSHVDRCSARASMAFTVFPVNLDRHKTKVLI